MICLQHGYRTPNFVLNSICCRSYSSAARWKPARQLHDGNVVTFRREAFAPSLPALLPKGRFSGLPAIQKWFMKPEQNGKKASFNHSFLDRYATAVVPLELTRLTNEISADESFQRAEVPFAMFLEWTKLATKDTPERLYLAQASFSRLPKSWVEDLPTPEIVAEAGTGDIYDTNLWMGVAPTYTPLHRDPNPNLFVQLAGHKIVRILPPDMGERIFEHTKNVLGKSGSSAFRGEEMMKGEEKQLLEAEIWDDSSQENRLAYEGYEAHVWGADGLFIPTGWWHSIKGVDGGISASVNWWFR